MLHENSIEESKIGEITKETEINIVKCCGCLSEITENNSGIQCNAGHQMCSDTCSKNFINMAISEPENYFPLNVHSVSRI